MKPLAIYILSSIFFIAQINAQNNSKAAGNWSGELELPGKKLELIFKIIQTEKGKLEGLMDVPAQGARDIPVSSVTYSNDSILLEVEMIHGKYSGIFSNDSTIMGKWEQNGATLSLFLSKTEKSTELLRPQTPQKPYPYDVEEVVYTNPKSGLKLAGTVTIPKHAKNCPAAILITGSGAEDRDETIFEHHPFLVIADYLTRNGIAVLRVDDRGVGGSEGNTSSATSADFASDVLAGINFLKNYKEISSSKIGLIGHSEGGLIAPIVATQSKDVSFTVLLAGPGISGEQILYAQGELLSKAAGMSDEKIQQNRKLQEAIYNIVINEKDTAKLVDRLQKTYSNGMYAMLNESQKNAVNAAVGTIISPWYKFFLSYNPYPTLTKVTCPVLALNGEKDLQVPPDENLAAIEKALTEGGNTNFKTIKMAGLNHLFQKCETGEVAEYAQIEETINPEVLLTIKDWILEVSSK